MLFNKKIKKLEEEKESLIIKKCRVEGFAIAENRSHVETLNLLLKYFNNIDKYSDEEIELIKFRLEQKLKIVEADSYRLEKMINS